MREVEELNVLELLHILNLGDTIVGEVEFSDGCEGLGFFEPVDDCDGLTEEIKLAVLVGLGLTAVMIRKQLLLNWPFKHRLYINQTSKCFSSRKKENLK